MKVVRTVGEAYDVRRRCEAEGKGLALVPTMGFLHAGHLALMKEGRMRAGRVVTSIFVNPTQFAPTEDLARYPRDLDGDLQKCEGVGVDWVFVPETAELYPPAFETQVVVPRLSRGLCGAKRPGHFQGVATVVTKLLALFRPTVALFGEKDYQQLRVVQTLASDLNLGVEVVGLPTVREADGLAMSSRNSYLKGDERRRARALSAGLRKAQRAVQSGERQTAAIVGLVRGELAAAEVKEDYVEVVDGETLEPLETILPDRPARLLLAGFVGTTRLIDNGPL